MNYIYCQCGARVIKGSTTINFCPTCGESFNKTIKPNFNQAATTAPHIKPKLVIKRVVDNEDSEEDEGDDDNTPSLLSYTNNIIDNPFVIDVQPSRGIKLGEIVGSRQDVVPMDKMNLRPKLVSKTKRQIFKEIQAEAGTLRPKS